MLSLFLASALLAPASQPPRPMTELTPTDKWAVEFADNRCVASRTFSGADRVIGLGIDQSPATDGYIAFYLLLPPGDLKPWRNLSATIAGSPEQPSIFFVDGKLEDGRWLVRTVLRNGDVSALRAGGPVEVTSNMMHLSFPLTGMAGVAKVLDRCTDDLLEQWGYGADFKARVAKMPSADRSIVSLFSDGDYPSDAIRAEQQGRVEARLTIGPDGKPVNCTILRSSGSAALDSQTCAIPMRRARFQPALDQTGKPLTAPLLFIINWSIPSG